MTDPRAGLATTSRLRSWLPLLVLCAVFGSSYFQWSVAGYSAFLVEDSGLFLHTGQRILAGDKLYIDVWDNKPPIIYYINTIGLFLTGGSPAGVLWICLLAGWTTIAVLWRIFRDHRTWPVTAIALCFLHFAYLRLALHPNFTETFAMPLQAIGIALLLQEVHTAASGRFALWQGIIAGLLVCIRPNNVGIAVLYALWIVLSQRHSLARIPIAALKAFAGVVIVMGLVSVPLLIQNTWRECLAAAVSSAGAYAAENSNIDRFVSALLGFYRLIRSFLLTATVTALLTGLAIRRHLDRATQWSVGLLTVWWMIEVALSCTSGYRWYHYYLMWLVPMTALTIVVGRAVAPDFQGSRRTAIKCALAALLLAISANAGFEFLRVLGDPMPTSLRAVALVRRHAREPDRFTAWGAFGHDLWFRLNLRPGTALFHEAAFTNREIYRRLAVRFLNDLERNRPRVVLENRSPVPLFAPPNPDGRLNDAFLPPHFAGWDTPELTARKQALARQYRQVETVGNLSLFVRTE